MSMKTWYASQTSREQGIIACVALVGIGALIYLFAVEPLVNGTKSRLASIETQKKDLAWMKQQESLVKSAGGTVAGVTRPMEQAPYLLLDKAIRDKKITAPERVTPDGSQGAKAQISGVEFDKLLEVLGGLDATYGLSVTTMNVSKKNEGLVNARFSLEVGQ